MTTLAPSLPAHLPVIAFPMPTKTVLSAPNVILGKIHHFLREMTRKTKKGPLLRPVFREGATLWGGAKPQHAHIVSLYQVVVQVLQVYIKYVIPHFCIVSL